MRDCRIHQDAMVPWCNSEEERTTGSFEQTLWNSDEPVSCNVLNSMLFCLESHVNMIFIICLLGMDLHHRANIPSFPH